MHSQSAEGLRSEVMATRADEHYPGCYRKTGHHLCAVAEIDYLLAILADADAVIRKYESMALRLVKNLDTEGVKL